MLEQSEDELFLILVGVQSVVRFVVISVFPEESLAKSVAEEDALISLFVVLFDSAFFAHEVELLEDVEE